MSDTDIVISQEEQQRLFNKLNTLKDAIADGDDATAAEADLHEDLRVTFLNKGGVFVYNDETPPTDQPYIVLPESTPLARGMQTNAGGTGDKNSPPDEGGK